MATTKQKKIEAPIDRRETFVSLSKNMNESDVSMETKLQILYKIQQTDTMIDKMHMLRGELPEEVRDLEDEVLGLRTRVSNIQDNVKEVESIISQKKIDIETCKTLLEKYEGQRGNVKNSREYDSLSKEIEFQGLELELVEKRIKESSASLIEKKATLEHTKGILAGREIDLVNKKEELVSIVKETEKEEEVFLKKLKELEAGIEERMIAAYRKVRSNARNKLAVVTVKRDACGGCFNKIPPQRQLDIALNKKIIVCEYCGRILVSSDFEQE